MAERASGQRGGDLGYYKDGDARVDAALQTGAASLAVNTLGGPVAVGGQWVVLMKTGERRAVRREIDTLRDGLRLRVLMEKRGAAVKDVEDRLMADANVQIDREALDKLRAQASASSARTAK